jgi:thiol reductant ABC exporter CydC subunit
MNSTFRRTLAFVSRYKGRAFLAVLLGFLTIGANIGLMGASGYLIAKAALRPETVLLVWVPIVGVRFFGLSRGVFRYLERLASHDVTFRVLADLRTWIYTRIEPRGTVLLEDRRSGDVLGSVVSDVNELQNFYLRVLSPPLIAVLAGLLGIGIVAWWDIRFGLILAVMLVLAGVAIPALSHLAGRRRGEETAACRGELYANANDLIMGLPELLVYGRAEEATARVEADQRRLSALQKGQNRTAAVASGLMVACTQAAMWLMLLAAIPLVAAEALSGIALPVLAMVALASFEAVAPLPQTFQQFGGIMAAAERLFNLADAGGPEAPSASAQAPAAAHPLPEAGFAIHVERMAFRYGPSEPAALDGISFGLPMGRRVAVVGESGAGKSSLLQVLLKLRPYEAGSVQLDGQELARLPEEAVRDRFAVVSQHVQLFNESVRDNLLLARPEATDEELQHAAKAAQIHDTILALPEGYDTLIGEWGSRLSGGERQRLGLARALLRNAPVLLFDEPTAGLDSVTEEAFLRQAEAAAFPDKSVLWITHKLTGLERMDHILVLKNGLIVERGTHEELLHLQGEYWRLFRLQQAEAVWQETRG